jgi:hypothetical protein
MKLLGRVSKALKEATDNYLDWVNDGGTGAGAQQQAVKPAHGSAAIPLFPEENSAPGEKRAAVRHDSTVAGEISVGFLALPEPVQLQNFSEGGMYFVAPRRMTIGEVVNAMFTMPADFSPNKIEQRISFRVKVRRVEQLSPENFGTAACITGRTVVPVSGAA